MREYIKKRVKLSVRISDSKELHYTAIITDVTDTHISFTDKYGYSFTYLISNIIYINEIVEDKKEELNLE